MLLTLPTWLALSATLLTPTTAFYPYQFDNNSPSSHRRTIPRAPSPTDTSITLPLRRVPRQNVYSIINSADPKQANSVAIDQDGSDLSYMVAVRIGDSKEEYHLLLDSAASNTWVMSQDCKTEACGTHNTFGKGDSGSLKTQDTKFSVSYGTGSVSGTLASDTMHIGPLSPALIFGLATNVSQEFASYPMDGILGIGRGVKSPGSIGAPQIMDVLSSSQLIGSKLYGIHLSRGADGLNDGELNFGEVNKERYTGDLNWSPIMDNENGFWEIGIGNAGVDGKMLDLTGRSAIIDTGTSFILMPSADAVQIHSQIPGFAQDGETFSVPCDTSATIQFAFNKQTYNISTADWRGLRLDNGLCRSNIIGRQTFKESQWLVGDVFLKNVYSVFDFEGKRVGLGTKREEKAETESQASSSASAKPSASSSQPSGTKVEAGSFRPSQTAALVAGGASLSPSSTAHAQGGKEGGAGRGSPSLELAAGLGFLGFLFI